MSIYVPHDTILRCSQSVKVSRLNVTSQSKAKLTDGRLKGTWLDKMDENFVCPYITMAGVAAGIVVVGSLGPLGMLANGLMALVGGLVGGVSETVKGWNDGSKIGGAVGAEIGDILGSVVGGNIGSATGTIRGAADGGMKGAAKGSETGGQLGRQAGEPAGSVLGGTIGATSGFFKGFAEGAMKGRLFLPSYLGGLIMSIPPICSIITIPVWLKFHPTVKIEGKFALLKTSILPCLMGGIVKPWIEDLTPHLMRALVSEAIYFAPEAEAELIRQWNEGKMSKKDYDNWYINKKKSDERMAKHMEIKRIYPTNSDLTSKMQNNDSGFTSAIYSYPNEKKEEVYVMVFKGTDNDVQAGPDWKTNGENAMGLESEQYNDTEKAAKAFDEAYSGQNIEFAGHSKAGGQATLAAAVTEKEASAFNPAGVNDATFERAKTNRATADQYVTSFHSNNSDILNTLQDHTYGLVPQAVGDRIGINTKVPYLFPHPIKGHAMEHLIEVLEKEVENYKLLVKTK